MGLWNKAVRRSGRTVGWFLAGFLLAYVASEALQDVFRWNPVTLSLTLGVLALGTTVFFFLNHRHLQELATRMELSVTSVEEMYTESTSKPYGGELYRRIADLVRDAQFRILVLTDDSTETKPETSLHTERRALLKAYVEVMRRHLGTEFTYTRIIQVGKQEGRNLSETEVVQHLSEATREHCKEVLGLKDQLAPGAEARIAVMSIPARRLANLVIIDHHVVMLTEALDAQKRTYLASAVIVKDEGQKLAESYQRYFDDLMMTPGKHSISLADFAAAQPTSNPGSSNAGGSNPVGTDAEG